MASIAEQLAEKRRALSSARNELEGLRKNLQLLKSAFQAQMTAVLASASAETGPKKNEGLTERQLQINKSIVELFTRVNNASQKASSRAIATTKNSSLRPHWNDWTESTRSSEARWGASADTWPTPDAKDADAVTQMLGRRPQGMWRVASRCPNGHPHTLRVYPLLRRRGKVSPAPTHYWLVCPAANKAIGTLEVNGGCAAAKEWVESDPHRARAYRRNHMEYAAARWAALTAADVAMLHARPGSTLALRAKFSGIGGAERWDCCKCLHQMWAHHRVTGNNIVGLWIERQLEKLGLRAECPATSRTTALPQSCSITHERTHEGTHERTRS